MTADRVSRRIAVAAIMLTIGTGGTDVVSFTRLGGVFTSVVTGNIALFGLAIVRASGRLAGHTALSIGSYVLGVAIGARVIGLTARHRRAAREQAWPVMVTVVLAVELALMAAFAVGWEVTHGRPAGTGQYLLQAAAATAMGMQSTAVRGLGAGNFSTTYLTGQLTGIISDLVTPGERHWPGWLLLGPLLALATGALLAGLLIANAPDAVPAVTVLPLAVVLVIGVRQRADAGS